ncbi:MAG: glycosyltransferase [Planctomycetes bacterium]|nr:glycosyltransferase [Planctomycetota bacterium]
MRILLAAPGKLRTLPMSACSRRALQSLGHEVTVFDTSLRWHDKALAPLDAGGTIWPRWLNRRFRRDVERFQPDLVLSFYGWRIAGDELERLRERRIVSACWWLNDPFEPASSLPTLARHDLVFSNDPGSVRVYRDGGFREAHWLPTACDPTVHRPVAPTLDRRAGICFAGDWHPLREACCERLARRFDVRIHGPWSKKLAPDSPLRNRVQSGFFTPEAMVGIFASSDIVLNLHTWRDRWPHGTNPRLFEAAGCGACQLVDRRTELPELFDTEREIATWETLEELEAQAERLLASPELRRSLGNAARRRALSEHTYEHRMRSLLAHVDRLR